MAQITFYNAKDFREYRANCRRSRFDALDKLFKLQGAGFDDLVIEKLPHGYKLSGSYHIMNDPGYYVQYAFFSAHFHYGRELDLFSLHFHVSNRYWIDKTVLRPFVEDEIANLIR